MAQRPQRVMQEVVVNPQTLVHPAEVAVGTEVVQFMDHARVNVYVHHREVAVQATFVMQANRPFTRTSMYA